MTKKGDSHDLSWFWWNSDKAVSPLNFNIVHQIQKESKSCGISYLRADVLYDLHGKNISEWTFAIDNINLYP